jgi:PAS domain S-box-containing protein
MKRPIVTTLTPEELREIATLPNHVIAIIRPDLIFHKVNEEANPVLGWEPAEVIGDSVKNYIHPEDWDETLAVMSSLFVGARDIITNYRCRVLHKEGGYRWLSWTVRVKGTLIYGLGVDVTEAVEFEEALSVQALVLENISEAVVISDAQGTIVYTNTAAEALFGYEPQELLGKNIGLLSAESDEENLRQLPGVFAELERSGVWKGEVQNLRKDGAVITTASQITPMSLGGERHFVCVQRDITLKKKRDQEREELQERYNTISERLSLAVKVGRIGIWEWHPGSQEVIWDEVTQRIYGYEPGTFPGTSEAYSSHLHPEERERLWAVISQALEKRTPYTFDHRIIRPDGSLRWVQGSGMAFYDEHGRPVRVMGTVLDITDRKEAEEDKAFLVGVSEILSSSLDYRENFKALGEFIAGYFCDGCIVELHQPELQKYDQNHPVSNTLVTGKLVVVRGNFQKHGPEYEREARAAGLRESIVIRLRGRESLLGAITFFNIQGTGQRFTYRHERLAEEICYRVSMALENSLLYLNSQEAIRARDEFLSIASHELKTPLQSLTLQNQIRRRQIEKGNPQVLTAETFRRTLEQDHRQLLRINRLIDDMLDITRIRANRLALHMETFDFCDLVRETVERFRPQIEAVGCELQLNICEGVEVSADSYRIEQVLVNLLTNAMKYGSGCPIRIETARQPRKVLLFVQDKGPGISSADAERIFQRFERAVSSSEVSGLGLGLYISRQIIEQHKGELLVSSEPGKGATFIVELPLP